MNDIRNLPIGAALVFLIVLAGCSHSGSPAIPTPTPMPTPSSLSANDLLAFATPATPIDEGAFAMPANAALPDDPFEGRLNLTNPSQTGSFEVIYDSSGTFSSGDPERTRLPPFSFEFVGDAGYLIPVQQGLIYTGHHWNYIVGPGRAWKQSDDGGYNRASFPFALVEMNQNCVHNGVMTFLYGNNQSPRISNVRYQITQETCMYAKVDLWGQLAATYDPYAIAGAEAIKSDHTAELANRLPTRPLSALAADYPRAGFNPAALIAQYRHPEDITTYGVLIGGVNYVGGCRTRFGQYAYCDQMRLPSYSTGKTTFNNVAAMRLGQLYGTAMYGKLIRDYVPEYTAGGDWTSVTIDHALDMATGNFASTAYMSDEFGDISRPFLWAVSYEDKVNAAFRLYPHQSAPGTVWVYQDAASFVANQAMNAYLREKRGADADIFNLVRDDIYKPLHLSRGGLSTLRTDNSETGRALGCFGLFYIQDDIAKLADLLNNDGGNIGGSQVLEPTRLRESMFRDPAVLGFSVPDSGSMPNTIRYNNSTWAKRITMAEYPQFGCEFWVPYMNGYGGISVVMLPNGATFYLFSDNDEYYWGSAAVEINKLAPICGNAHALSEGSAGR